MPSSSAQPVGPFVASDASLHAPGPAPARGAVRQADVNRATVLRTIRQAEGLTRADIVRYTHMSPQTVSNVVKSLMRSDLIIEGATVEAGGRGRPGTTLRLNPRGRFAVGVHIDPAAVGVVAVDLRGDLLCDHFEKLPSPDDPTRVMAQIAERIARIVGDTGLPASKMLGIGIVAPGPLDEQGRIINPPLLPGWHEVSLHEDLEKLMRAPVVLDKDVTAAAQAHVWRPSESIRDNFIFLYVGAGIAVSVVLGGRVWRGPTGNAGEAGHFPTISDGVACECGQRGCLGASLGAAEIVRHARAAGLPLPGREDSLNPLDVDAAFAVFLEYARSGNRKAAEILHAASRSVARVAQALSQLLDLDTLVIGGPRWADMRALVSDEIERSLQGHAIHGLPRPIRLVSSPLEWRGAAMGAACLVLGQTYAPSTGGSFA